MNIIASLRAVATLGLVWSIMACGGPESPETSSPEAAPAASAPAMPRIGVQLWSVKDALKEDYKGTIETLAAMGFEGVELFTRDTLPFEESDAFGEFGDDPAGLKNLLENNGMVVSSAHVHFKFLSPENFDKTVAFYQTVGCKNLFVPMDRRAWDPEGVKQVVAELNELSEKLAPYGITFGYHNHAQEFADYKDATYWDFIARSTSENVTLQLDVGWVTYAGKDPVEYVRRYPGRTLATHYKIRTPEGVENLTPIIGQDTIDWAALLDANIKVGGTKWIVMEQEEYANGMTTLEAVKASKAGLDGYLADYRSP